MLSSDKMSEIRQPVLSLKLDVATATQATGGGAGGGGSKEIVVEMTKEETDRVLRSMDAAYQHMEKLKS
jgi:ribulose 1,5-bisphosphate synthetase/thiazole synthase